MIEHGDIARLLDEAFPPIMLDDKDLARIGGSAPLRQMALLASSDASQSDDRSVLTKGESAISNLPDKDRPKFTSFEVLDLDPLVSMSEALSPFDIAFPIQVTLSSQRNGKLYPVEYATRYALSIASIFPSAIEAPSQGRAASVLCLDGVCIESDEKCASALLELIDQGVLEVIYTDIDATSSDACASIVEEQIIPTSMFEARPRGNLICHADIPKRFSDMIGKLSADVQLANMVCRFLTIIAPLFRGHSHMPYPFDDPQGQSGIKQVDELLRILSCDTLSISDIVSDDTIAKALQHPAPIPCKLDEFAAEHLRFSKLPESTTANPIGMSKEDAKRISDIVTCWKKVVVSDLDDQELPGARDNGACGNAAAIKEIGDQYDIGTFVTAVNLGIPIEDLMLDDIERTNHKRLHESIEKEATHHVDPSSLPF